MAAIVAARHDRFGAGNAATALELTDVPENASSANATSRAVWNRSAGFFSRQWRTIRSSAGDRSVFDVDSSGGSSRRIAVIVSAAVSRLNARSPDSIS